MLFFTEDVLMRTIQCARPTLNHSHFLLSGGQGEKSKVEKLVGWDKDREATYQLPSRAAQTKNFGKINVIYSQLKKNSKSKNIFPHTPFFFPGSA